MIRSPFRTQARGNADVRSVLSNVNEFISQDLRSDMFITCVYGILDVTAKRFSWARAGHEPIIVAHPDEETDVLSPQGFALGVIGSPEFAETLEVTTIDMRSGDRLLMFTDGLTEAMNSNGEEFGMERILGVMENHNGMANGHAVNGSNVPLESASQNFVPSESLKNDSHSSCEPDNTVEEPEDMKTIEMAIQSHVGDAPQSDDLTIVYLAAK
jgi:serine phosphatase RsbU (regulator of sigma subunit)